jgi:hypothetical protein
MYSTPPLNSRIHIADPNLPFWDEIKLRSIDRWMIFYRLQELSIDCKCGYGQPLQVHIQTASTAIQVWHVIQRVTAPQTALIDYLERCWQAVRTNP